VRVILEDFILFLILLRIILLRIDLNSRAKNMYSSSTFRRGSGKQGNKH